MAGAPFPESAGDRMTRPWNRPNASCEQIKRQMKRAGSQRRRRQWKRDLRENPEEAPYSEEDFGRYSTAEFNGIDQDHTRNRE